MEIPLFFIYSDFRKYKLEDIKKLSISSRKEILRLLVSADAFNVKNIESKINYVLYTEYVQYYITQNRLFPLETELRYLVKQVKEIKDSLKEKLKNPFNNIEIINEFERYSSRISINNSNVDIRIFAKSLEILSSRMYNKISDISDVVSIMANINVKNFIRTYKDLVNKNKDLVYQLYRMMNITLNYYRICPDRHLESHQMIINVLFNIYSSCVRILEDNNSKDKIYECPISSDDIEIFSKLLM